MEALMDIAIDASIFFSYTNSAKLRFHSLIRQNGKKDQNFQLLFLLFFTCVHMFKKYEQFWENYGIILWSEE